MIKTSSLCRISVAGILAMLALLSSCSDLFSNLDNPVDPEAPSYQGTTPPLTFLDNPVDPEAPSYQGTTPPLTFVEGGSFSMGSASGGSDERPVHTVTVSSFYLGTYEVTQLQYAAVIGINPSNFTGDPKRPVERVTWYDAVEFCNKLSQQEDLEPVYTITGRSPASGYPITSATVTWNQSKNGYRLPTEAEWEYAARGGQQSRGYEYSGGADVKAVGWYSGNSGSQTHAVGTKAANELGIYDMSGNVWEWCWDWYGNYSSANQTNPTGASSGSNRVGRGGGWDYDADYVRSAFRDYYGPSSRSDYIGFRVLAPPQFGQ